MIKVQATQLGYYGHRRRHPGEVFVIKDQKAFSTKWMKLVSNEVPETVPAATFKSSRSEEIRRAEEAEVALKNIQGLPPPAAPTAATATPEGVADQPPALETPPAAGASPPDPAKPATGGQEVI